MGCAGAKVTPALVEAAMKTLREASPSGAPSGEACQKTQTRPAASAAMAPPPSRCRVPAFTAASWVKAARAGSHRAQRRGVLSGSVGWALDDPFHDT